MPLNILICGGGLAGPALAFWLARAGHAVTIIERFPALRATGAQVDLREQGLQVVKRMGLLDIVRTKTIDEDGVAWVDYNGKVKAKLLTNKTGKGAQSYSSEYEIMRGDLVRVLYEATKDSVTYRFGIMVEHFTQDEKSVTVTFSDGTTGQYDMLVGADGQGSRIRKAILPQTEDPLKHLGIFYCNWEAPIRVADDKLGRCTLGTNGKMLWTRNSRSGGTQVGCMLRQDSDYIRSIPRASTELQRQFWTSNFRDVSVSGPRLTEAIPASEYFYCQEIVQVHTDTWHKGRVVLLGDAAHCPSQITGMGKCEWWRMTEHCADLFPGTTSAFTSAYVLAGEIISHPDDLNLAFRNFDKKLRPFVNEFQSISMWAWSIIMPYSQWTIILLHFIVGWITYLGVPSK